MLGKQQAPNSGTARLCAITGRGVDEDGWYTNHQVLTGYDPVAWVSHAGARMLARASASSRRSRGARDGGGDHSGRAGHGHR
jgi:hypothetical protein